MAMMGDYPVTLVLMIKMRMREFPACHACSAIIEDDSEEEVNLHADDDAGSVYQDVPEDLINDSKAPMRLISYAHLNWHANTLHSIHIAICEDCGFAVHRSDVEGHYRGKLHRGKHGRILPQPAVLKKLLDEHQILGSPAAPVKPIVYPSAAWFPMHH